MAWSITDLELEPEQPVTQSLLTRLRDGGIETSVQMMARQNAAPLGWTKVTSGIDDKAIRLFSGAPSDGGSSPFSTVFGKTATDGHTISQAELPGIGISLNDPTHSHTFNSPAVPGGSNPGGSAGGGLTSTGAALTGITATIPGSNAAHTHPMDIRVSYVGMCLFQKS